MRPIEFRADSEFDQALKCVQYRVPQPDNFRSKGYLLSLALRYGLLGSAMAHHLLLLCDADEEQPALDAIATWPQAVERHAAWHLYERLAVYGEPEMPVLVARWSRRPLQIAVPLYRRMYPLEVCLEMASDDFMTQHSDGIREDWPLWHKARAMSDFADEARQSVMYAMNFFERRSLGLEELPEIALLGE
jgi:hypothetical protein